MDHSQMFEAYYIILACLGIDGFMYKYSSNQ